MVTQHINSQTASLQPIAWHPDILRAGPGELSQSINTWSRLRLVGSFCRHPLYHRHPAGCRVDREEEIKPWSRIRSHHQITELNCCNVQGASRSSSGMDAYHHRSAITVCLPDQVSALLECPGRGILSSEGLLLLSCGSGDIRQRASQWEDIDRDDLRCRSIT